MIFGIGADIVEISRIEDALKRHGEAFAQRVLTDAEFAEFKQTQLQVSFLAKRFAAKEAFAKALGTGLRPPATMHNIGLSHDEMGKPLLVLAPELQAYLRTKQITRQHISISDEKLLALAMVVLE